jgi:hypothetical protein
MNLDLDLDLRIKIKDLSLDDLKPLGFGIRPNLTRMINS